MQTLLRSLLVILTLTACERVDQGPQEYADLSVSRAMSAQADAGFARAVTPRQFEFPADHGPHPEYALEWWYFTGNLGREDGRRFGYQLTLFRIGLQPPTTPGESAWRSRALFMGHLAVSDIAEQQHYSEERFSRAAAGLAGAQAQPLKVWLGPWSIEGDQATTFPLSLRAEGDEVGIDLRLERGDKPVVLQGDRGLSRKGEKEGNASYYYSHTRLPTRGEIRIGAQRYAVHGDSWFDREWSSSALDETQQGWDWFALQLADGRDLMFYRMRGKDGQAQRFSRGVLVDTDGRVESLNLDSTQLDERASWTSPRGVHYPVEWSIRIPHRQIDLQVRAVFEDQEMQHSVHYWEGAVEVSGSHRGKGYLELSGYAR